MSQPQLLTPPTADPFAIGWRDVTTTHPDGSETVQQVPLTLEDALHPHWGDVIVGGRQHATNCSYLLTVLEARYANNPAVLVLADTKVQWDDPELRHHSPDIAVIFDVPVRQAGDEVTEFLVAEQGVRPRLIIEVVSLSTRRNDIVTKLDHYYRARVPFYAIVDRTQADGPLSLRGYQRTPRRYAPLSLEDDGTLWLEAIGLYLGVSETRVALYDESGAKLGNYAAVSSALVAAEQRANRLAARLRELGIDPGE